MTKFVKLSDVCEIISGVGPFPNSPSGKMAKFVLITDLHDNLITAQAKRSIKVASKYHKNLDDRKKIKKNDVILSIQGMLSIKAIASKNMDYYASSSLLILRPKNIVPEFLLCALNSRRVMSKLIKSTTGNTIKRIPLSFFSEHVKIPYPSKSEQLKIKIKYEKQLKKTRELGLQALKAKIELENFAI
jgi:type I restriction enzyme, S subunit